MRRTVNAPQQWHCAAHQGKMGMLPRTCTTCWKVMTTPIRIWPPPSHRQQSLQNPWALPPMLGQPSMQTLPQHQLLANQTAIMLQMGAMSFAQAPVQHTHQYVPCNTFQVPPIQQVAIPMQQHFPVGDFNTGSGGHQGGQGHGSGWDRQGRNPFADYMQAAGAM